ncbi:MAG: BA14K family protein [Xanthobacteraceae bacterium]|nr:BA14K family protein [Xanthobacteraceae bacterium]
MAVPPAPASSTPATAAPVPAKPEASVAAPLPAGEARQPMTLQSAPAAVPSASENRTPRDVAPPPPRSTAETAAPAAAEPPRTTGARDTPAPKCNQQACADAYRSFDATDCTYQPANGPRRLCNRR